MSSEDPKLFKGETSTSFGLKQANEFLNNVYHRIGGSNHYQFRVLGFFSMQMMILSSIILSSPSFLFATPKFKCKQGDVCSEDTGGCLSQGNSLIETDSIVYEFHLFCDGRVMRVICESCFFMGAILGTIIFTFYQMRRKRFLVLTWVLAFLGLLGAGLSPSVGYFIGFWSLTGFAAQSCYVMSNAMTKEQSKPKFYQRAAIFYFMLWGASQIIFALIYQYITTNWRYLILFVMATPSFLIIFAIYFLKESPRYLYFTEGKLTEAINTLNEIATINGKETFSDQEILELTNNFIDEKEKKYNYFHLFSFPSLRRITIPTGLVNFAFDITYYNIQFSFSRLGLSLFTNALYVGCGEILVYIIAIIFILKLPRQKVVTIGYFITALLGFLFVFDLSLVMQSIIMITDRCVIAFVHSVIVLYFPEVYPTNVRLIGVGFINLMGRLVWVAEYSGEVFGNSMVCVAFLASIGCIASLFLKETLNVPTQDTLDEELAEEDAK